MQFIYYLKKCETLGWDIFNKFKINDGEVSK